MSRHAFLCLVIGILFSCLFVGCPAQVWIPLENQPRAAVAKGDVQFLDSLPTRSHKVIGIITPPAGAYETEAETVKDMRKIAAKYGADAIYIESQSEKTGGWRFEGWSGGSFSELHIRAKAIVWK